MPNVYVDKSGSEYSIHCLSSEDLDIIAESLMETGNSFLLQAKNETHRAAIRRIIHIKNAIENEREHHLQHQPKGRVPAMQRRKNSRSLSRLLRAHKRARFNNKALPLLPR